MAPGKSEHDLPWPVQGGSFSARVTSVAGSWPMAGGGGAAVACRGDGYTLGVLGVVGATTPAGGAGRPFG